MPAAASPAPAATRIENAATALLGGNPADEMPEVELQAVAAEQARGEAAESAENQQNPTTATAPAPAPAAAGKPGSKPVLVDAMGRTFDPLLHETEDGVTPMLRADGQTIRCRRVPLKAFKSTSKVQLDQPGPAAADPGQAQPPPASVDPEKLKRQREAGARTCAGIQVLIMRKSLGEHIAGKESDQAALVECWDELFEHYGMGAVHPIVGLAVITGMITFEGMKEVETRNRLGRALLWCKLQIGWLWYKATGRRPAQQPQPQQQPAAA